MTPAFILKDEATPSLRRIYMRLKNSVTGAMMSGAISFSAGEVLLSKAGAAEGNATGTLTEAGGGTYYYQASAGEVNTYGPLLGRIAKSGIVPIAFSADIVAFNPYSPAAFGMTLRDIGVRDSGTATAVTDTTITLKIGTVIPQPGNQVEIMSGPFEGFVSNYSMYNVGTRQLTIDPHWTGLTGTPDYRLLSAAGAQTTDPINVELTIQQIADLTAALVAAVSGATDAWATDLLTGGYSGTQAGAIVLNRIDAAISSRLAATSYTAPPSAASILAVIKADPDIKAVIADANGILEITPCTVFPGTAIVVSKDKVGGGVRATFTYAFNLQGKCTGRTSA